MLTNGVHETTTTSGTGALTLVASGELGVFRVSERYSVGQPLQYVAKSQTTAKMEEGYGKAGASNTLDRPMPTFQHNGTVLVPTPSTPLDFAGETVDVWVTPVSGGIAERQIIDAVAMTSHANAAANLIPIPNTTPLGASYTWNTNRQVWFPALKSWNGPIDGLAIWAASAWNASAFVDIYLYQMDPEGGFGTKLESLLTKNATASGWLQMLFASPIDLSDGLFWISVWADDGGPAVFPEVGTMEVDACMPFDDRYSNYTRGFWRYISVASIDPPPTNLQLNAGNQPVPRMAWIKS